MKAPSETTSMLLEHPYLHDGLTAEGAFNYLLSHDRDSPMIRGEIPKSSCVWMKKKGFSVVRNSQMNRYFWEQRKGCPRRTFDKGKPLGMFA